MLPFIPKDNYKFFNYLLSKYKIYGGNLGHFGVANGWTKRSIYFWKKTGVPKRAWAALKKEFEIMNLVRSLDHKVTINDIVDDHTEFVKQELIK